MEILKAALFMKIIICILSCISNLLIEDYDTSAELVKFN